MRDFRRAGLAVHLAAPATRHRRAGRTGYGLQRLSADGTARRHQRLDARFPRLILKGFDFGGRIGNAGPAAFGFDAFFRLAWQQDFIKAFGFGNRAHAFGQRVDAGAVVLFRDEQVGFHGEKEVTDVLRPVERLVLVADVAAEVRAGDYTAENVHEQRQAGALVLADRQHYAARERRLRIGGRP